MPSKQYHKKETSNEVSLIFVEGDTDEIFYKKTFNELVGNFPRKTFNLKGNHNLFRKIADKTAVFINIDKKAKVRVYCCIDRESRYDDPPLDLNFLRETFYSEITFNKRILSADTIIATQMIESWFFHDIEGIFNFLRVPHRDRNPDKYKPIEKFTDKDLSRLFFYYKKIYIKGKRCENFVEHLDLSKIYNECEELQQGIDLIKSRFKGEGSS